MRQEDLKRYSFKLIYFNVSIGLVRWRSMTHFIFELLILKDSTFTLLSQRFDIILVLEQLNFFGTKEYNKIRLNQLEFYFSFLFGFFENASTSTHHNVLILFKVVNVYFITLFTIPIAHWFLLIQNFFIVLNTSFFLILEFTQSRI